jgi:nucleotide-binding universal stress UspA family protein
MAARGALRWTLAEGRRWERSVEVLWAAGSGASPAPHLHELVHDEAAAFADVEVVERVVRDQPGRALVEAGRDAELLVVGARGMGGMKRLLLGSVSDHCVQNSACPVVVVRVEPADTARSEIVVGVDGSEHSRRALEWALAEATRRNAAVQVVHGWSLPSVPALGWDAQAVDFCALEAAAREAVDRAVDEVAGIVSPLVEIGQTVQMGHPGRLLLDTAAGAELLVVGARGIGGMAGLLVGSTAAYCVHHGREPVVVVR